MSVLGSQHGMYPGMGSSYLTYERAFLWGGEPKFRLITGIRLDSTTVDARSSPTTRLQPGLVLGKITSSGEYKHYDPTATDGSQIAVCVLLDSYSMVDVFSGSATDRIVAALFAGPCVASQLGGLDWKARWDLHAAGFLFDDDVHGPNSWRQVEVTSGSPLTITVATYPPGTEFVANSGGAYTFTLPAIAAGLRYRFYNAQDQNMTVQRGGSDNLITFNNAAAASVAFSTAGNKIGACVEVAATYVGSSTYKWRVMPMGANTMTVA